MLALVAAVRVYRLKHGSKLLSWGDFRQDFPQDPKIAQTITALLPYQDSHRRLRTLKAQNSRIIHLNV